MYKLGVCTQIKTKEGRCWTESEKMLKKTDKQLTHHLGAITHCIFFTPSQHAEKERKVSNSVPRYLKVSTCSTNWPSSLIGSKIGWGESSFPMLLQHSSSVLLMFSSRHLSSKAWSVEWSMEKEGLGTVGWRHLLAEWSSLWDTCLWACRGQGFCGDWRVPEFCSSPRQMFFVLFFLLQTPQWDYVTLLISSPNKNTGPAAVIRENSKVT